jgi:hypothetical protein
MAWLSDGSQSPATRFRTRATTPYVRVDGVAVAKNWQDVTKGNLAAPVLLTETGAAAASFAWTHTTRSGDANDGPAHCGNWRSASQSVIGDDGQTNLTGRGWTNEGAFPCNQAWTLYCFQQT